MLSPCCAVPALPEEQETLRQAVPALPEEQETCGKPLIRR